MRRDIFDSVAFFAEYGAFALGYVNFLLGITEYRNQPVTSMIQATIGLALGLGSFAVSPITPEKIEKFWADTQGRVNSRQLRSAIKSEPFSDLFHDSELTIGSRQLVLARYLRISQEGTDSGDIASHIASLHGKLSNIETLLKSTPSFGAEFFIESKALAHYNPHFDMKQALFHANNLMCVSGSRNIRRSGINPSGNYEVRISPSYAPITAALAEELFHVGILPREVMVGFAINMVIDEAMALPIALTHLYLGLTPILSSETGYALRKLHVYKGATVGLYTGKRREQITQMNMFTGIAGDIRQNPHIGLDARLSLATDIKTRYRWSLLPFLVPKVDRDAWSQAVYGMFELDSDKVRYLQNKIARTDGDNKIWDIERDVPLIAVPHRKALIAQIYSSLEDTVASKRPELYFKLAELAL